MTAQHRPHCPLMGCVGCAPSTAHASLDEAGTVRGVPQDERNNAAVAVGADMARAVLAAEYFRQTGHMPGWTRNHKDPQ